MAKQIKPTPEAVDAALSQAREQLLAQKSTDGNLKVEVKLPVSEKRMRVQFAPVAYAKMLALIQGFSTEVGWYGIVTKASDSLYRIKDILVYPQEVTGATIRTDTERHTKWLMERDDETYCALRMQGHSHVHMAAKPSAQDLTDQSIVLDQMGSGCKFYIFMVWNKKLEHDIRVYDLDANLLFEDKDVDLSIGENGANLRSFVADAQSLVKAPSKAPAKHAFSYQGQYPPGDDYPWTGGPAVRVVKGGKKKRESGKVA